MTRTKQIIDVWGKKQFIETAYYQILVAYQALQLVQNWNINSYEIKNLRIS